MKISKAEEISKEKKLMFKQLIETMNKIHKIVHSKEIIVSDHNVTTPLQIHALAFINTNPNETVGELAKNLGLSPSATAQLTDRLYISSWVIRTPDEKDRRIVRLSITQNGIEQMNLFHKNMMNRMSPVVRYLSESDLKTTISIHKKLLEGLEKEESDR